LDFSKSCISKFFNTLRLLKNFKRNSIHHCNPDTWNAQFFPASTDARFTSVGADAIKRFARPICFQNWSNELLPDELKDENPLKICAG
jgi:hypothetical protein